MPITTKDGLLEAWVTQIEAMEQNLEALYGPPGITPTLPDITTINGMIEAITEQAESAYVGMAKLYGAYHSDTHVYNLAMPSNLMDWYGVKKVGGRTIVWNQIAAESMYRTDGSVSVGVTCTHTEKGFTLTGTTNATSNSYMIREKFPSSRVYAVKGTPVQSGIALRLSTNGSTYTTVSEGFVFTSNADSSVWTYIAIKPSATGIEVNLEWTPQIFDLTTMFGAGNEPTTYEEFAAMFPAEYYEYNAGTLMSAGVTDIVTMNGADTVDAYTVPAEVQALAGYGMTCPNRTNYIDFEAKKFYQYVGSVDLSTLTWGYGPSVGWSATLNAKNPADDDTIFNGISATLTPVTRNVQATAFSGGTDAGMVSVSGGKVYVGTGDINTVPSGVLHYELATPVETDISAYLTDTPAPHVESGWDIIFKNQHGDDYRIPVPVQADYIGV